MKTQETSSRMKHKAKSPLVGLCLAFAVLAINIPAQARSTTGWGGFRGVGINCVNESYGAVVNKCSSPMRTDP